MIITRVSSLPEVAFIVCTALERNGVTAVLTGGSAATVYAPHAYQFMGIYGYCFGYGCRNQNR